MRTELKLKLATDYLPVDRAAEMLGITPRTLYLYAAAKTIPSRRVRGSIRFARVDVIRLRRTMQEARGARPPGRPTLGETNRRALDAIVGVRP